MFSLHFRRRRRRKKKEQQKSAHTSSARRRKKSPTKVVVPFFLCVSKGRRSTFSKKRFFWTFKKVFVLLGFRVFEKIGAKKSNAFGRRRHLCVLLHDGRRRRRRRRRLLGGFSTKRPRFSRQRSARSTSLLPRDGGRRER